MSDKIQFRCRMRERSQPRTEVITYQVVQVMGALHYDVEASSSGSSSSASCTSSSPSSSSTQQFTLSPSSSLSTSPHSPYTNHMENMSSSSYHDENSCISTESPVEDASSMVLKPRHIKKRAFDEFIMSPGSSSTSSSTSFYSDSGSGFHVPKRNGKKFCPTLSPIPSSHSQYLLFKGFVQVIPSNPLAELSLIESSKEEYVSRLSLDGTLLYADHR